MSTPAEKLQQTPLHALHVEHGAKMVEFGGWHMPLQYQGIVAEHKAVRASAGAFDVSHMGEISIRGPQSRAAVNRLITGDAGKMVDGAALYTVMCYADGGIVDDCIVYQRSDEDFLIVVNASNIAKDLQWIREVVAGDAEVVDESAETALIAVQGPEAVGLLDELAACELTSVERFHFTRCQIAGVPCMAARTGYTGEDGFELACAADRAPALWSTIVADPRCSPIGLGARDTLRLEARLSLYGNDIDATTTPLEAGLGWVVKLDKGDFVGREALAAQKAEGVKRKLVGFVVEGRGIARHGYPIVDRTISGTGDEQIIGRVTSGTTGITVGGAIGLGYVPVALSRPDTPLTIDCRGKDVAARVVKGPFYKRG